VVEEEVLLNFGLGDTLGPGNDGGDVSGGRFAGSEFSGESLSDSD